MIILLCRFYCIAFIEYMIAGKMLEYTNLFFFMTIKRMASYKSTKIKYYIITLKKNMANLNFRLKR